MATSLALLQAYCNCLFGRPTLDIDPRKVRDVLCAVADAAKLPSQLLKLATITTSVYAQANSEFSAWDSIADILFKKVLPPLAQQGLEMRNEVASQSLPLSSLAYVEGGGKLASFLFLLTSAAETATQSWINEYWLGYNSRDADAEMLDRLCRAGIASKVAENLASSERHQQDFHNYGLVNFILDRLVPSFYERKDLNQVIYNLDMRSALLEWRDSQGQEPTSEEMLAWFVDYVTARDIPRFTLKDLENATVRKYVKSFFEGNKCERFTQSWSDDDDDASQQHVLLIPSKTQETVASDLACLGNVAPNKRRWFHGCTAIAAFERLYSRRLTAMMKPDRDLGKSAFYLQETLDGAVKWAARQYHDYQQQLETAPAVMIFSVSDDSLHQLGGRVMADAMEMRTLAFASLNEGTCPNPLVRVRPAREETISLYRHYRNDPQEHTPSSEYLEALMQDSIKRAGRTSWIFSYFVQKPGGSPQRTSLRCLPRNDAQSDDFNPPLDRLWAAQLSNACPNHKHGNGECWSPGQLALVYRPLHSDSIKLFQRSLEAIVVISHPTQED